MSGTEDSNAQEPRKLNELLAERRSKLEQLRADGVEPFPVSFADRTDVAEVVRLYSGLEEAGESDDSVRLAGRLSARRGHGKASFLDLVDRSGRIQLHARLDVLGEDSYRRLVGLDLGDLIGVEGSPLPHAAR